MNNLSLLNKINAFHNQAHDISKFAEDLDLPEDNFKNEKFDEIMNFIKTKVKNSETKYELFVIAKLYKEAVKLDGGFEYVKQSILKLINNLNPDDDETDDPELEQVEAFLDYFYKSIKNTGKDSPEAVTKLRDVKNDIIGEEVIAELSDKSKYQVDPTGFSHSERHYSDKLANLQNKKARYIDSLNYIKDPKAKFEVNTIVKLLDNLISLRQQKMELEDSMSSMEVSDPELEAQYKRLDLEDEKISKEMTRSKAVLKPYLLHKEIEEFFNEAKSAKNPRDKLLAEQNALLRYNMLPNNVYTGEANMLRRKFIKRLNQSTMRDEDVARELKAIQDASAKIRQKEDVNIEQAVSHKTLIDAGKNTKDYTKFILKGKIKKLKENLANTIMGHSKNVKEDILDALESNKGNILETVLSRVTAEFEAENQKDKADEDKKYDEGFQKEVLDSLKQDNRQLIRNKFDNLKKTFTNGKSSAKATHELRKILNLFALEDSRIVSYLIHQRTSKFFKRVIMLVEELAELVPENFNADVELSDEVKEKMNQIINFGEGLVALYKNGFTKTINGAEVKVSPLYVDGRKVMVNGKLVKANPRAKGYHLHNSAATNIELLISYLKARLAMETK